MAQSPTQLRNKETKKRLGFDVRGKGVWTKFEKKGGGVGRQYNVRQYNIRSS